jgi:hypothetical protein
MTNPITRPAKPPYLHTMFRISTPDGRWFKGGTAHNLLSPLPPNHTRLGHRLFSETEPLTNHLPPEERRKWPCTSLWKQRPGSEFLEMATPDAKGAVVELTDEYAASGERPKMISDRAKGVAKIVEVWDRLNVGKTDKCAYRVALKEAQELAMRLNTGEA